MASMERMLYTEIQGSESVLDETLYAISRSGLFHMEDATARLTGSNRRQERLENPYTRPLKQLSEISAVSGVKLAQADCADIPDSSTGAIAEEIGRLNASTSEIASAIRSVEEELERLRSVLEQISHIAGGSADSLDFDFEQLFACKNIKTRYGRFTAESYEKLPYYTDKSFIFTEYGKDNGYYYGFIFAPLSEAEETDEILSDLYFERIHIPEYVRGNVSDAVAHLKDAIAAEEKSLNDEKAKMAACVGEHKGDLDRYFSKLKSMHDTFELRSKVLITGGRFKVIGFLPASDEKAFREIFKGAAFEESEPVSVSTRRVTDKDDLEPPVKLRNGKFSEPFTMFVDLYGLPGRGDVNPTTFLAISYTLLFGIMFGDLGQGFVLLLAGIFLGHVKKIKLGRIIERLGVSSMIFGTLYGSVFGFEELLDPVYESLGITFLPFKTIANITTVLYTAIGIGVVLILTAMLINIIKGLAEKDFGRALFSNSGLAGMVFFVSLLLMLLGPSIGIPAGGTAYVLLLIILPLLLMFLHEPLSELCRGKGFKIEGSVGDFIASNFFECFEYLLGYATNTLSFVRVGGFVLSHAGMMSVVLALSHMAGNASPVVIVIGNIFVMGLEGLLVGIQVLRLQFYELFSRYYTGGGKPFVPVSINYDEMIS
ncbi:MAG: hypothetical protein IJ149_04070 [Oscillospiraceae bacterium]|nr:hypothetical protein [Oscillospiraceae bacterium]